MYGSTNDVALIVHAKVDKMASPDPAQRDQTRTPGYGRKLIVSAVITAALAAGLPGAAAQASSPTAAQYDDQVTHIRHQVHQATAAGPDDPTIGALPFTGVDLVILAFAAMALLGAGFALKRWSATGESDEHA